MRHRAVTAISLVLQAASSLSKGNPKTLRLPQVFALGRMIVLGIRPILGSLITLILTNPQLLKHRKYGINFHLLESWGVGQSR